MKKILLVITIILGLTISCNSIKNSTTPEKNIADVDKEGIDGNKKYLNSTNVDLSIPDQLRKIASVSVQGTGADAIIYVRGKSSINMSSNPLFIVNDQIVDGGYAAIFNLINPRSIKHIEVLKTASEISFYGSRGANGVIKITTN